MCHLENAQFNRRQLDRLMPFVLAFVFLSAACGEFVGPDADPDPEVDPPLVVLESPQMEEVNSSNPIAIGSTVEVRGADERRLTHVTSEDPDVFEVESVEDNTATVHAVGAGEGSLGITFAMDDETYGDGVVLRAEEPEPPSLRATCWMLDAAELIVEEPDHAELDYEKLWLTDSIYEADSELVNAEGEQLYGNYLHHHVEPQGSVEVDRWSNGDVSIATGGEEVAIDIGPDPEEPLMTMELVDEERSELAVVRVEDPDQDPHWRFTFPGEEPVLDLEENKSYPFLPHRMAEGRAVCEPEMLPEYRITSKTPDVCLLTEVVSWSDEDDEPVESLETKELGALHLESEGECSVSVEFLDGPDGYELEDEWTWTVE